MVHTATDPGTPKLQHPEAANPIRKGQGASPNSAPCFMPLLSAAPPWAQTVSRPTVRSPLCPPEIKATCIGRCDPLLGAPEPVPRESCQSTSFLGTVCPEHGHGPHPWHCFVVHPGHKEPEGRSFEGARAPRGLVLGLAPCRPEVPHSPNRGGRRQWGPWPGRSCHSGPAAERNESAVLPVHPPSPSARARNLSWERASARAGHHGCPRQSSAWCWGSQDHLMWRLEGGLLSSGKTQPPTSITLWFMPCRSQTAQQQITGDFKQPQVSGPGTPGPRPPTAFHAAKASLFP